jgi:hypothetical protein
MNGRWLRAAGAEEIVRPRRLIGRFWAGPSTSPLDRHMGAFARFQTQQRWSLIPGPRELAQPVNSQDVQDIELHPAAAIADSFLSFPGMRLVNSPDPSWWQWRARWESGPDFIEVGMTLFDDETLSWGGSPISADCTRESIEALWSHMQSRHSGVWLHEPECTVHTHESFGKLWESNNLWRGP